MPHNADFSKLKDIKQLKVNPNGWVNPLTVEYGIGVYGVTPSIYWRVKGTEHTFVIPVVRLEYLSSGDYASHFNEVLKNFREDYLEWKNNGFQTDWAREYKRQYRKYIL